MIKLSELPKYFEKLEGLEIEGYSLSQRVLEPIILIDKVNENIVARLAAVRNVKGQRKLCFAPSNFHSWVVDETVIRPLPRDAKFFFDEAIGNSNAESLSYTEAFSIFRDRKRTLNVEFSELFSQSGLEASFGYKKEVEIPSLNAELFPYQARGVQWMRDTLKNTGGVILADEMGLGKTLQIIALLLLDPPSYSSPALIICPSSLIANWVREIEKFSSGLDVMVHRGAARTGVYLGLQQANVVLTTYDTMVNDISIFSSFEWSWVICDEAQAIKNPDSNRRRAVGTIPRRRAIPMTGTPVENSLLDLWSLTDFAVPGLLGSRKVFETNFNDDLDSARLLSSITDPITLKRKVVDVAGDLPERIDVDVPLELDDKSVDFYLDVRQATLEKYSVAGALVATLQLQLVCAHPWLVKCCDVDMDVDSAKLESKSLIPLLTPKMERVISIILESFSSGRKVLVFSLFNNIQVLIREALSKATSGFFYGVINGSTPSESRQVIVDDFSQFNGAGCLVLNPKAAGAGLNITAATVVIHFTPVWNPALEAQASARSHRRGQTQPVTVYRLFYKNTVEEIMLERAAWKRELANQSLPVSSRDHLDFMRALQIAPERLN